VECKTEEGIIQRSDWLSVFQDVVTILHKDLVSPILTAQHLFFEKIERVPDTAYLDRDAFVLAHGQRSVEQAIRHRLHLLNKQAETTSSIAASIPGIDLRQLGHRISQQCTATFAVQVRILIPRSRRPEAQRFGSIAPATSWRSHAQQGILCSSACIVDGAQCGPRHRSIARNVFAKGF
jgi:hypothetical protein